MRQKIARNYIVEKYINFLQIVQQNSNQSLKYLVQINSINKSVIIALKKLNLIYWSNDNDWHWIANEVNKQLALEVLNFLLELNKKEMLTPIMGLDEDTKGYIKAIHDHLISNSQNKQSSLDGLKTGMLSKALNQVEQTNSNHLFTQVENNEAKKFELLKAIASGVYTKIDGLTNEVDIDVYNDGIICATEDLFNKFFSKK